MHRLPFYVWSSLAAVLYVSLGGCATPPSQPLTPPPVVQPAELAPVEPQTPVKPQVPAQPSVEPPPQVQALPLEPASSPGAKSEPHIALLLPLKSVAFGRAAETLQRGFLAAASSQRHSLPIKIYGSFDESKDIVALYQLAVSSGAVAVAGPLTRDGVTALAAYPKITVPTLALNVTENRDASLLYSFSLSVEAEARQVAQMAAAAKLRYATIVSTGAPLSKRLSAAFAEEWKALGGSVTAEILFHDNPAVLALLPTDPGDAAPAPFVRPMTSFGTAPGVADPNFIPPPVIAPGNMVFLVADVEKARIIRPYLHSALPIYATSQLFNSNADTLTNYDLADIRFVDMPWLLQPDHPAVMIYPRANPPLTPDMERLYALGIDAFRLLQILLDGSYRTVLPLDGVTGRIRLSNYNQMQREGIPAQIKQGRSQISDYPLPVSHMPILLPARR